MKLIKQRTPNDCMLAALAMVLGKEYDELWTPELLAEVVAAHGCNTELTAKALAIAGLKERVDYWHVYTWGLSSDCKRLFMGRKAVLSVPSLNYEHGQHAVAWDGRCVYDPSTLQVYQWLQHLEISTAIIFNEV